MRRGFAFLLVSVVTAVVGCGGSSERRGGGRGDGGTSGSATGGSGGAMGGMSGSAMGGAGTGPMAGTGGSIIDPENMRSCEVPSDCVLVPSCCFCGTPELSDVAAVNARSATEWSRRLCAMMPPCGCTSSENPNLVATCESRICVKIDIRDHVVSECSEDSDCRVRATDCCECGADVNAESLVAVGRGGGYEELVCPPSWACPECEPVYPPDVGARCNGGNCILERL